LVLIVMCLLSDGPGDRDRSDAYATFLIYTLYYRKK